MTGMNSNITREHLVTGMNSNITREYLVTGMNSNITREHLITRIHSNVTRKPFIARMKNSRKGAVTIEYALVFPVVIICIMILLYIGLIYYQQALLQSVVSENAQNCALLWGYDFDTLDTGEGITSMEAYQSEGLYWHVFSDASPKKDMLQEGIKDELLKRSILKPSKDVEVEVIFHNYLIVQKVGFKADITYKLPFADGLLKVLGQSEGIKLSAYSEITVYDPKEFIHNVDYLLQIYDESGASDWVKEKLEPVKNSLNKIKGFIN